VLKRRAAIGGLGHVVRFEAFKQASDVPAILQTRA